MPTEDRHYTVRSERIDTERYDDIRIARDRAHDLVDGGHQWVQVSIVRFGQGCAIADYVRSVDGTRWDTDEGLRRMIVEEAVDQEDAMEFWYCDPCNDYWMMSPRNDRDQRGMCPTCGHAMDASSREHYKASGLGREANAE